ncbi:MAG: formylglycine-generating enzyme family protein [Pseudodesulfovibrio sp.]
MKRIIFWVLMLAFSTSITALAAASKPIATTQVAPSKGDIWTDPTTDMEFVWIPGGCYQMGSNSGDDDEKPVHEVCVDGFWMGKYEVTQVEWKGVMGNNPSYFKADRNPVERVTWNDAQSFIKKMNTKGNGTFRLPTEAEWEFAARGGTGTTYWWGDSFSCDKAMCENESYSAEDSCTSYVQSKGLTPDSTAPVGRYSPNPFSLYDTAGNVWEWCEDVYSSSAYLSHSHKNPIYIDEGNYHVIRGGGWYSLRGNVRSADRLRSKLDSGDDLGFRLLRTN